MACLVVRGNVSIVLPRWQAQRVGGEYFSSLLGLCTGAFAAGTLRQGLFYLATTTLSISLLRMAYIGFRLWRLERS